MWFVQQYLDDNDLPGVDEPLSVGSRPGSSPRCHFPKAAVAYPAAENSSATVYSHGASPEAPSPGMGTRVVPDRTGSLPVSSAARVGVHCASTLVVSQVGCRIRLFGCFSRFAAVAGQRVQAAASRNHPAWGIHCSAQRQESPVGASGGRKAMSFSSVQPAVMPLTMPPGRLGKSVS